MANSPVLSVSFEDCRRELIDAGGPAAQEVYRRWRARADSQPAYKDVVAFVEGFTHQYLFTITEDQLEAAKMRSQHALGQLRKEEAEDRRIEDFDTPFALHHLFHMYLEQKRQVPAWQDWWEWMTAGEGKPFYIAKVQERFNWRDLPEADRSHLRDAVQWRLGKFYYSAFRELELFTKLRSRFDLPVKYHILADVLLRADLWLDKTVVSLFFGNPQYREGTAGRKNRPQYFLEPGFRFVEATLPRQGFGRFWKVPDENLAKLAQQIANGLEADT